MAIRLAKKRSATGRARAVNGGQVCVLGRRERERVTHAARRHRRISRAAHRRARGRVAAPARRAAPRARTVLRRPAALLRAAPAIPVAVAVSLSPAAGRRRAARLSQGAPRRARGRRASRAVPAARDWERELAHVDPGFRDASPVSRLDAFFVAEAGGLRFTEYNAETPAGGAYNDVLTEVFFGLPDHARVHAPRGTCVRCRRGTTCSTRCSTRTSSGRDARRCRASRSSTGPTCRRGASSCSSRTTSRGRGSIASSSIPREVEYDGKRARGPMGDIDSSTSACCCTELVERGGIDHPILRAVRDAAVCMVNPPRCKILHKKASLAVLHDERNAHLFDAEEREAIAASIPWTRVVEDRATTHEGARSTCCRSSRSNREQLVLKPNDEYGGKGIVLGWEVDDDDVGGGDRARRSPSRTSCSSASRCRGAVPEHGRRQAWCSPTGWWTPRRTWRMAITSTAVSRAWHRCAAQRHRGRRKSDANFHRRTAARSR